jgi:hypothetical protein
MSSAKFDKLASEVGSKKLAGWITTHEPKVAARAKATRAKNAAKKTASKKRVAKKAAPKRMTKRGK